VSSFSGLQSLAEAAGWGQWMAPLLPATVDAFALAATRLWLLESTGSRRARRFARTCAIGAIAMSQVGNGVWHLVSAQLLPVTWHVVLVVGAVPPLVLGLVTHLAVLRRQVDPVPAATPPVVPSGRLGSGRAAPEVPNEPTEIGPASTEPRPPGPGHSRPVPSGPDRRTGDGPRYRTEDELLEAGRQADTAFRAAHGRAITRDALRQALRIGGPRATELLRRLKEEARS
jgi:hypothetical protein